jgi:gentisate 1,2-dioxygenase
VKERPQSSPLLLYSWEKTYQSLGAMREIAGDEWDDIALEYTHPQTGRALLPTMACWVQMLRPGSRLKAHRHTGSAVYYVVQGAGETIIDGVRFTWGRGDVIVLPPWALHEHANTSSHDAAILFSIQDRPVLEALGLYREEALTQGGGHQKVTSSFKV